MSGNPQGSVLGASTIVGASLASTGAPTWVSFALGISIFASLFALYFISKLVNKNK